MLPLRSWFWGGVIYCCCCYCGWTTGGCENNLVVGLLGWFAVADCPELDSWLIWFICWIC